MKIEMIRRFNLLKNFRICKLLIHLKCMIRKKYSFFYFLNMHYALSQKIMMLLLRDKFKKINGKCASFHTWLWTVIYDIFIKLKAVSSEENNSHYSMQDKVYQKPTRKSFICNIILRFNDTYISQILENTSYELFGIFNTN